MQLPIFCSSCAGSLPPVVAGDSPCLITMDLGDAAGTRAVLVIEKKTERERENESTLAFCFTLQRRTFVKY